MSFHSSQTRYSFKYRPDDQQIVLKVTDDRVVRFPTRSVDDGVAWRCCWIGRLSICVVYILYACVNVCVCVCLCVCVHDLKRQVACIRVIWFLQVYKFKTDQANELKYVERLNQAFFRLMSSSHPTADLVAPPGMVVCSTAACFLPFTA